MVDIIVPVYNTPLKDLERSLNSIYNQTFKNYLVYIIDDGSNDLTKDFLDNYVKDKNNFIVKHIVNSGVSNARNLGIQLSNNKYITFVDSDDTLEDNFLSEALELIESNDLDLIIGGYNEISDDKIIRVRKSLAGLHIYENKSLINFFQKLLSGKTNDSNKEIGDCPTGRIYTRLFKRDSIGKLRFSTNIKMSEDTLFMINYMYQVKRIGVVDKVWYNYYINDYSISNGTKKEKLINNIKDFIKEIEILLENEDNLILKEAYKKRIEKAQNYIKELEL